MASINYILQLTVVRLSIVNKETDGLAMFVMGNSHSIFWALASAYIFMNLAMLFVAPVFDGGRLERWIRWLFIANGASVIVSIFGVVVDSPAIYLLVSLVPWCIIFSLATALVAVLFKRREA
jgi:Zn-dependent protease